MKTISTTQENKKLPIVSLSEREFLSSELTKTDFAFKNAEQLLSFYSSVEKKDKVLCHKYIPAHIQGLIYLSKKNRQYRLHFHFLLQNLFLSNFNELKEIIHHLAKATSKRNHDLLFILSLLIIKPADVKTGVSFLTFDSDCIIPVINKFNKIETQSLFKLFELIEEPSILFKILSAFNQEIAFLKQERGDAFEPKSNVINFVIQMWIILGMKKGFFFTAAKENKENFTALKEFVYYSFSISHLTEGFFNKTESFNNSSIGKGWHFFKNHFLPVLFHFLEKDEVDKTEFEGHYYRLLIDSTLSKPNVILISLGEQRTFNCFLNPLYPCKCVDLFFDHLLESILQQYYNASIFKEQHSQLLNDLVEIFVKINRYSPTIQYYHRRYNTFVLDVIHFLEQLFNEKFTENYFSKEDNEYIISTFAFLKRVCTTT